MKGEGRLLAIPGGVDDFREIREGGYYFVDKSELVSDIVNDRSEVFLFTRPRRFGKSLNLSMIDAFFNLEYKGNKWFDGLKVNSHPEVEEHRNAYPVIRLCMKDLFVSRRDMFLPMFKGMLSRTFRPFEYLKTSDKVSESLRDLYLGKDPVYFEDARALDFIPALCQMLEQHHGVKPIVLIDEYDNPINNAFNKDTYDYVVGFIREFYSLTLKGNTHMSFAVVTGVMQIAKESIFSGLNNLRVDNVFSKRFDERYGFTEPEVKDLCSYYGHPEKFEEAKEWYDGYRFGNADVYNPWDILMYIRNDFEPGIYWADTSGNDILDVLLENADRDTNSVLVALGNGQAVVKGINPTVAMEDVGKKPTATYSIMAVTGYLNAVTEADDICSLSIPNRELYKVFYDKVIDSVWRFDKDLFKPLFDSMENADVPKMEESLFMLFSKNFPDILLKDEADYQLVLATIALGRGGRYDVGIEREAGNGRADIIMRRNDPRYPNIVVELKKSRSKTDIFNTMEKEARKALTQIKTKEYYLGMKGKTYLYGVCFQNKKAKVLFEEMDL
ncbi:AAA family ATPase [Methanomethylophilus alvi]|uniref:AAA family ATPase n=1 Tax=Methanomethylophilus alvi TaxID=1291540 RepID=UPI0037DC1C2A